MIGKQDIGAVTFQIIIVYWKLRINMTQEIFFHAIIALDMYDMKMKTQRCVPFPIVHVQIHHLEFVTRGREGDKLIL